MDPLSHNQFEIKLTEALAQASAEPTSECIDEETLWDFVDQGASHPHAHPIIAHLASCIFCHQGYSKMIEFQGLALQPTTVQIAEKPTWMPSKSLWSRVTIAIAASLEPVFPRQLSWQHAAIDTPRQDARQPIIFDDPHVIGSYLQAGDEYDLHIEHSEWPAGTLVALESTAPDGSVGYCNFFVLKGAWERSALDTAIDKANLIGCFLRLRMVNASQLGTEEEAPLEFAFHASLDIDPDSLEDWHIWATETLNEALTGSLTPEIEGIARQILAWKHSKG
jgi:hypothetical protein